MRLVLLTGLVCALLGLACLVAAVFSLPTDPRAVGILGALGVVLGLVLVSLSSERFDNDDNHR